jgi:alpha-L-fucosidase
MKAYQIILTLVVLIFKSSAALPPAGPVPVDTSLQWFIEGRFGLFIHWGLSTVLEGEWQGKPCSMHAQNTEQIPLAVYVTLTNQLNPTRFDAMIWVRAAKSAGIKYIVYVAKHHDGFAMFDSPSDPYNITRATPFKRDPLKELSLACQKEGIVLCVYYSLGRDWHVPGVPVPGRGRCNKLDFPDATQADMERYLDAKVKPQLRELLTQYGPIGAIWFDTPECVTRARSEELQKFILTLQPNCLINARIGNGLGDYDISEKFVPGGTIQKPWESCIPMSKEWGYCKWDDYWKSADELLRHLIDIVSKGGNFLLNVGPRADGMFPPPAVVRLKVIGDWMHLNGEAIYGTGPTCFGQEFSSTNQPNTSGIDAMGAELKKKTSETPKHGYGGKLDVPQGWRCTTKPGKIYLMIFNWPTTGKFELAGLQSKVTNAYLLAGREQLKFNQTDSGVSISLPEKAPDSIASVVCLEIKDAVAKVQAAK